MNEPIPFIGPEFDPSSEGWTVVIGSGTNAASTRSGEYRYVIAVHGRPVWSYASRKRVSIDQATVPANGGQVESGPHEKAKGPRDHPVET